MRKYQTKQLSKTKYISTLVYHTDINFYILGSHNNGFDDSDRLQI